MKNSHYKLALIVVFVLIVAVGGIVLFRVPKRAPSISIQQKGETQQTFSKNQSDVDKNQSPTPVQGTDNIKIIKTPEPISQSSQVPEYKPTCKDYGNYFVITRGTGEVGDDILIKYKPDYKSIAYKCEYVAGIGDYILGGAGSAEYFTDIISHFAITDDGTSAGSRGLTAYDLNTKKQVFHDSYQTESLKIDSDSFSYFTLANIQANPQNCLEYDNWSGSASINTRVIVSVPDFIRRDSGEHKCFYVE